ncbi:response regulator transcription factor [Paenibacillus lignilyticus]|uniref:Response regulator transcription factor n=1 Tax=Paenibacillus lignilyticus TaxID=1172615 RepID=A0ABS5CGJ6_9BACL|nr:response regulator transcription factor [Paenibacillus lignilyticus]MBP3964960.1 response regulator transcription factor [Paenibacillus lignilyticus]
MKIMIVEDDATIRDMIWESLNKWGFETAAIVDFQDVMGRFAREEPHLVLLDINLPVFDGFYWCSEIRAVSKVPILFISSRNTPMDMIMSMNMGGDDFIQKPFRADVLIAKINALLRRTYTYMDAQTSAIEHDGILLNLKDGALYLGERKAELTKTEFVIMSLLMRQKGSIVTRTKLMRSLWEDESFVDDNTLTVNIVRLRKKLAELGREDFISTRKGQGYMIE